MLASRQVEIPSYRGISRQRGREFDAIAQFNGRTAFLFYVKISSQLKKRVGADLLEVAVPKIPEVVSGRKTFKTVAKSVGRQTLRKQFGSGSKKKSANRVIPTKSAKEASRSRRDNFTKISH